jgi:tripartite-type tricarboxylate transporter receptor subunit TctC
VPRSYFCFCGGSGDAVGRHLTQTFNFAVCSHRVSTLDCARDIAQDQKGNAVKLPRRTLLHLAAGAVALPAISRVARAQTYPTRPVRLLVGWPPGGAADVVGRLTGQLLSERLGQQFVIENRPGAGGNLAVEALLKAAPDGYTLLMIGSNNAWNVTLYDNLSFDFVRDIAPVASIVRGVGVLVVHPSVSAKSLPDLIAYAKANPGKINMASGGVGSPQHVYGELFKMMAGVDMLHVPYRGGAPALTDLLAGQVQVMFDTLITSIEHIRAGKLRPLAVTAATRVEVLPDIPTVGEFVPGYEAVGWQGVGVPRTTPVEIIDKLNKEINAGLADPRIKARIADLGYTVLASSPADFGRFIAAYTEKWAKVIKFAGAKVY